MKFILKVQEQFVKSGWTESNNSLESYKNSYKFNSFPDFLKNFLKKYGNIIIKDLNENASEVVNKLYITPDYAFFEYEQDPDEDYNFFKNLIGKDIYPFAFIYPDGYRIACDSEENVYMLGDYIFKISDNLKEGIEILITDNWSGGFYELDVKTKQWRKKVK